jgi:hypothetical protein
LEQIGERKGCSKQNVSHLLRTSEEVLLPPPLAFLSPLCISWTITYRLSLSALPASLEILGTFPRRLV